MYIAKSFFDFANKKIEAKDFVKQYYKGGLLMSSGKIDYSKLHRPKKPSPYGHSTGTLRKNKEIPGRYKPYYRYDTSGSKMTVISATDDISTKDKEE